MVHKVTVIIFFSDLIKLILEMTSFLQEFTARQREFYFNTVFWLLFNSGLELAIPLLFLAF